MPDKPHMFPPEPVGPYSSRERARIAALFQQGEAGVGAAWVEPARELHVAEADFYEVYAWDFDPSKGYRLVERPQTEEEAALSALFEKKE